MSWDLSSQLAKVTLMKSLDLEERKVDLKATWSQKARQWWWAAAAAAALLSAKRACPLLVSIGLLAARARASSVCLLLLHFGLLRRTTPCCWRGRPSRRRTRSWLSSAHEGCPSA